MKNILKFAAAMAAAACLSCSKDYAPISGNGDLAIEFDQAYGNDDLVLNSSNAANSQGETLKISDIKYIVGNMVLTNENGQTFTYPKAESYFVIDEIAGEPVITLHNVPAGNYTAVRFTAGIDQPQYDLGENGQGSLPDIASDGGLYTDWPGGYTNLLFTGTFSGASQADVPFAVSVKKQDGAINDATVSLSLPTMALVRTDITPEIHLIVDTKKILDGAHKISLSEYVDGSSATLNGGSVLTEIAENLAGIFTVAHVHND
jgi:hypothetical protein